MVQGLASEMKSLKNLELGVWSNLSLVVLFTAQWSLKLILKMLRSLRVDTSQVQPETWYSPSASEEINMCSAIVPKGLRVKCPPQCLSEHPGLNYKEALPQWMSPYTVVRHSSKATFLLWVNFLDLHGKIVRTMRFWRCPDHCLRLENMNKESKNLGPDWSCH